MILDIAFTDSHPSIRFKYTWHEVTEKGFMFAMPWRWKGLNLNTEGLPMPQNHLLQQGTRMQITDFQVCIYLSYDVN